MASTKSASEIDPEIGAISTVHEALKALEPEAQARVLAYVAGKLKVLAPAAPSQVSNARVPQEPSDNPSVIPAIDHADPDSDGISDVALKWIRRSGLTPKGLSSIFSLGVDEIDLVAKSVPGDNKKERMRSVVLLKGVAAYLGTGVARVTQEQIKEACLHYDAFDSSNFANYLKSFAAEVSGSKASGFTLTARGITNATALIKEMPA